MNFIIIFLGIFGSFVRGDHMDDVEYQSLNRFLSDLPDKGFNHHFTTTEPPPTTTQPPPPQCFREDTPMVYPPSLFSNKSEHYPFQESGLQIFLGMKIPCDGILTAWQFLSAHTVIWGLHFGIFRRTCFDVFQLVSDTYINGQTTGTSEEKWVAWRPANPIPVKRGDLIGIFYDRVDAGSNSVAVRSITLPDDYTFAPRQFNNSEALVFLYDAESLAKTHGCVRMAKGRVTRRIPALFILMTPKITGEIVGTSEAAVQHAQDASTTTAVTAATTKAVARRTTSKPDDSGARPECNRLPKFDYSCDTSLGVRYYYDKISKLCRQFLFCPTSEAASVIGFQLQSECVRRCSESPGFRYKAKPKPGRVVASGRVRPASLPSEHRRRMPEHIDKTVLSRRKPASQKRTTSKSTRRRTTPSPIDFSEFDDISLELALAGLEDEMLPPFRPFKSGRIPRPSKAMRRVPYHHHHRHHVRKSGARGKNPQRINRKRTNRRRTVRRQRRLVEYDENGQFY